MKCGAILVSWGQKIIWLSIISISYFCAEVNHMYNFNSKKNKKLIAIIVIVVVAAMVLTTILSALLMLL